MRPISQYYSPIFFNPILHFVANSGLPQNCLLQKPQSGIQLQNPRFDDKLWNCLLSTLQKHFHKLNEDFTQSKDLQDAKVVIENVFSLAHFMSDWTDNQKPTPWMIAQQNPVSSFSFRILINGRRPLDIQTNTDETWLSLRIKIANQLGRVDPRVVNVNLETRNMSTNLASISKTIFGDVLFSLGAFQTRLQKVSAYTSSTYVANDPLDLATAKVKPFFSLPPSAHPLHNLFQHDPHHSKLKRVLTVGAKLSHNCQFSATHLAIQLVSPQRSTRSHDLYLCLTPSAVFMNEGLLTIARDARNEGLTSDLVQPFLSTVWPEIQLDLEWEDQLSLLFVALVCVDFGLQTPEDPISLIHSIRSPSSRRWDHLIPFEPIEQEARMDLTLFLSKMTSFLDNFTNADNGSILRLREFLNLLAQEHSTSSASIVELSVQALNTFLPESRRLLFASPALSSLFSLYVLDIVEKHQTLMPTVMPNIPPFFLVHTVFLFLLNRPDGSPFLTSNRLQLILNLIPAISQFLKIETNTLFPFLSTLLLHQHDWSWSSSIYSFSLPSLTHALQYAVTRLGVPKSPDLTELIPHIVNSLLFSVSSPAGKKSLVMNSGTRQTLFDILLASKQTPLADSLVSSLYGILEQERSRTSTTLIIRANPIFFPLHHNDDYPDQQNVIESTADGYQPWPYRGITNPGSMCYAISVLQVLFMNPQLRAVVLGVDMKSIPRVKDPQVQHFRNKTYHDSASLASFTRLSHLTPNHSLNVSSTTDQYLQELTSVWHEVQLLMCRLQETNKNSLSDLYERQDSIRDLAAVLRDDNGNRISLNQQEDASDFYSSLLFKLSACFEMRNLPDPIKRMFFCDTVVLKECAGHHVSEQSVMQTPIITCTVIGQGGLVESLENDTTEKIGMQECQKCGDSKEHRTHRLFRNLPNTIAFNLQRYIFDEKTNQAVKVNNGFMFPVDEELDLFRFTEEGFVLRTDPEKAKGMGIQDHQVGPLNRTRDYYTFRLVGAIIHSGVAAAGHYYSYIRERSTTINAEGETKNGRWIKFDDGWTSVETEQDLIDDGFGGVQTDPAALEVAQVLGIPGEQANMKIQSAFILVYERVVQTFDWVSDEIASLEQSNAPLFTAIKAVFAPPTSPLYHFTKQSELIPSSVLARSGLNEISASGKDWSGLDLQRKSILYTESIFDKSAPVTTFTELGFRLHLPHMQNIDRSERERMMASEMDFIPFPFLTRTNCFGFQNDSVDFNDEGDEALRFIQLWTEILVFIYARSHVSSAKSFFVAHTDSINRIMAANPSLSFILIQRLFSQFEGLKSFDETTSKSVFKLFFNSNTSIHHQMAFAQLFGIAFISVVVELSIFMNAPQRDRNGLIVPISFSTCHPQCVEVVQNLTRFVQLAVVSVVTDSTIPKGSISVLLNLFTHLACSHPLASTIIMASGVVSFLLDCVYPSSSEQTALLRHDMAWSVVSVNLFEKTDQLFKFVCSVYQHSFSPTAQSSRHILNITPDVIQSSSIVDPFFASPPTLPATFNLKLALLESTHSAVTPYLLSLLYSPLRYDLCDNPFSMESPSDAVFLLIDVSESIFEEQQGLSINKSAFSTFLQIWSSLGAVQSEQPREFLVARLANFFTQLPMLSPSSIRSVIETFFTATLEDNFFTLMKHDSIVQAILKLSVCAHEGGWSHLLTLLLRRLSIKPTADTNRPTFVSFADDISFFTQTVLYSTPLLNPTKVKPSLTANKPAALPNIHVTSPTPPNIFKPSKFSVSKDSPTCFTFSSAQSSRDVQFRSIFSLKIGLPPSFVDPASIVPIASSDIIRQFVALSTSNEDCHPSILTSLVSVVSWIWMNEMVPLHVSTHPSHFVETIVTQSVRMDELGLIVRTVLKAINSLLLLDDSSSRSMILILVSFFASLVQTSMPFGKIAGEVLGSLLRNGSLPKLTRLISLPSSESLSLSQTGSLVSSIQNAFLSSLLVLVTLVPSLSDVLISSGLITDLFEHGVDRVWTNISWREEQILSTSICLICASQSELVKQHLLQLSQRAARNNPTELAALLNNLHSHTSFTMLKGQLEAMKTSWPEGTVLLPDFKTGRQSFRSSIVMQPPPPK
ncbi:putative Ubiquitin carboxyl-terminal hydrolase 34 [Blattamonas nauphoetae]|uniref:Ubiquitin carboxyl-terminal hydrolase 34 n=1 Tax=Blattamonas nauphoetae TaxID=2049346 RepID=A0ABQ9XEX2_9EUKA|nr:putative Ubiquitin carboxyl-terminal hydrolase 34 [Blattamonas nauphoetae]